jgi:HD-GYP domain-containing protein (c-di-GMP phosphodiesterase class II)
MSYELNTEIWPQDLEIEGWSSEDLFFRNKETREHTFRVTEMTLLLATLMGISEHEIHYIKYGALLHDIGHMGIPENILLKPGKLSRDELFIMQKHPDYAYDLMYPIEYFRPCLSIPYSHHEKWDGTGYPQGLKDEQIPLSARLFAIADVWDTLSSTRVYREAWPLDKVLNHIKQQSGTHFDPRVVELFLHVINNN